MKLFSIKLTQIHVYTDLLLAEFSVRTVNQGPSFFLSIYGPRASRLGKNEDP